MATMRKAQLAASPNVVTCASGPRPRKSRRIVPWTRQTKVVVNFPPDVTTTLVVLRRAVRFHAERDGRPQGLGKSPLPRASGTRTLGPSRVRPRDRQSHSRESPDGRSPAPGAGIDHLRSEAWIARPRRAGSTLRDGWKSYDRDDIAALFADDVAYRFHPYAEPWSAATPSWPRGSARATRRESPPGTRRGPTTRTTRRTPSTPTAWSPSGTSVYQDHPDGPVTRTFDNCFLIRFDGEGRCAEFTELYKERAR